MIRSTKQASSNNFTKRSKEPPPCSYTGYECTKGCLDGYAYCMKHILEDPNAPYKQCGFVYNTNGRKCQNPAPRMDKRDFSYCSEHARKAQIARIRSASKHSLPQSPEVLLLNLKHYAKIRPNDVDEHKESKDVIDPFRQLDAAKVNTSQSDVLDYASSSDSDIDATVVTDTIKTTYLDDSDNESVHDSQEDPLKHAGIYTAEEVVYISREKLIRLQSLYIEQFKRLQYVLREKRRRYLHALKKEKETLCSIHDQPKETPKERKIYEKLKALNKYHRRCGEEAILYRKSLERRAQVTEGFHHKAPSVPKCIFTEGGVKCGERSLPSAKHCRKHILKDQNQVLFKACGAVRSDVECHEPVPVIFDTNCVFHLNLPGPLKIQPMKFEEKKVEVVVEASNDVQGMEIDVVGSNQETIDPEDDMAGIMREMNDVAKKPAFGEGNSETSTDTALSFSAHTSDKDEFMTL